MSFWEDASPLVKGILIVGVLGFVYVVVARFAGFPPYACQEGLSYDGVIWGECVGETQERGLQPASEAPAEGGGGE